MFIFPHNPLTAKPSTVEKKIICQIVFYVDMYEKIFFKWISFKKDSLECIIACQNFPELKKINWKIYSNWFNVLDSLRWLLES